MRGSRDRTACCLATLSILCAAAGCQTDPPRASGPAMLRNAAPVGSPLARVSLGMTKAEVADAIGDATESRGHVTAKNFNPLYFGGDRYRTVWRYAGQGRLTFDMHATLILIEYDPTEPRRAPAK